MKRRRSRFTYDEKNDDDDENDYRALYYNPE